MKFGAILKASVDIVDEEGMPFSVATVDGMTSVLMFEYTCNGS